MKGSAAVFSARRVVALARELEQLGEARRLDEVSGRFSALEGEVQSLLAELKVRVEMS
jgi:HPt (histidine-containing phosphotransfer) domain-containing protein